MRCLSRVKASNGADLRDDFDTLTFLLLELMSKNLTVRPATVEDASAIIRIFNPIIEDGRYTVFSDPFTEEQEADFIKNLHPRGIFSLAEGDSEVVGFQVLEPFSPFSRYFDHTAIIGTYVDELHQGKGVSKVLFEHSMKKAREKGFEKVIAYVRGDNPRALAAYLRQGFKIIGTAHKQAKIRGEYVDEVFIEKFI